MKLKLDLNINYSSQARARFTSEEEIFLERHITDTHYNYYVLKNIPGHEDHVLLYDDQKGSLPWYTSPKVYKVLSIFMLSSI